MVRCGMALVVMMMVSGHSLLLLGNWPHSDADDKEMFEHILHIGSNTMCTLTTFCLLEHIVHIGALFPSTPTVLG